MRATPLSAESPTVTQPRLPCETQPDQWLQPHETIHWAKLPAARHAIETCLTACPTPAYLACAKAALTAGTVEGEQAARPADGVIMAGVVCAGDNRTIHELNTVIRDIEPTWAPPEQSWCQDCGRVFVDKTEPATPHTAHAATKAQCISCYRKHPNLIQLRPTHCLGCERPMTTRSKPLPDHVRHEADGFCARCVRENARKDSAA